MCVVSGGLALGQTARPLSPGDAVAFEAVATRGGLGMRFSMLVNGRLVETSDLGPGVLADCCLVVDDGEWRIKRQTEKVLL